MIVTKLRMGDANTMMAEGGIQAADKENDSPAQHFIDAFGGGHFMAKRELLEKLPLDGNSDDFAFDAQMLAQIIFLGRTIAEVLPLSTYLCPRWLFHFWYLSASGNEKEVKSVHAQTF